MHPMCVRTYVRARLCVHVCMRACTCACACVVYRVLTQTPFLASISTNELQVLGRYTNTLTKSAPQCSVLRRRADAEAMIDKLLPSYKPSAA